MNQFDLKNRTALITGGAHGVGFDIAKKLYKDLDEHLSKSDFLAGKNYSIADIATFPWIARHEWHDIGLKNYKNLSRWYLEIAEREAVIKGYNFMKKGEIIPKP